MNSEKFNFIDLFAGIGGIRIPFSELGGICVFTSEIDLAAQKSYKAYFKEKPHGDITKISPQSIPDHDILLGGFPCQAFSIMGKMQGFEDTRGNLFFNIAEILSVKKPFGFLLENVKQFKTHDKGKTFKTVVKTLEALGYYVHVKVLNALDYGLPQKRERTILVGFRKNLDFQFPKPFKNSPPSLNTILQSGKQVPESCFASKYILEKRQESVKNKNVFYPSVWHENKAGNISILPYSCALRAGASYNYLLVNGQRRFTARELLRIQGFPEDYPIVVSMQQIKKQTGNSVPVNMIRAVAKEMMKSIKNENIVFQYISPLRTD